MGRSFKDYTGQKFGKLTAIRRTVSGASNRVKWEFQCDCGKIVKKNAGSLQTQALSMDVDCGCSRDRSNNKRDYTGRRMGDLVALNKVKERSESYSGAVHWLFQCDCGNQIIKPGSIVFRGDFLSCGCRKEFKPRLINDQVGGWKVLSFDEQLRVYLCRCFCGHEQAIHHSVLNSVNLNNSGCRGCSGNWNNPQHFLDMSWNSYFNAYKGSAKTRKIIFDITLDQFKSITLNNCFYCNTPPQNKRTTHSGRGVILVNGVDRLDSNQGYTIDNIVPACSLCNIGKHTADANTFITSMLAVKTDKDPKTFTFDESKFTYFGKTLPGIVIDNARRRGIKFNMTWEETNKFIQQNCFYCDTEPKNKSKAVAGVFYQGIDRVDSSLPYQIDNCVPACWRCNCFKKDMSLEKFYEIAKGIQKQHGI